MNYKCEVQLSATPEAVFKALTTSEWYSGLVGKVEHGMERECRRLRTSEKTNESTKNESPLAADLARFGVHPS